MFRYFLLPGVLILLCTTWGLSDVEPQHYEKISQCVLVRERPALAGTRVQLTGKYVRGSKFCLKIPDTEVNTWEYTCFALGNPCMIRLYLKNDHPKIELLDGLEDGQVITVYGVFGYRGLDYNYLILDDLAIRDRTPSTP